MVDITLNENEQSRLHTKIMTVLIPLSRSGIDNVSTEKLVDMLNDAGFSLTVDGLVDHLQSQKPKFVDNVTTGSIVFSTPSEPSDIDGATEAEKSRQASRSALSNIKDRAKQRRDLAKDVT